MKKLLYIILAFFILGTFHSCEFSFEEPKGEIIFWTDAEGISIDVYVDGEFKGTITSSSLTAPDCGTAGSVTVSLEAGSYTNWYAEQNEAPYLVWNENFSTPINITEEGCASMRLESSIGQHVFWSDLPGIIDVYMGGDIVGTINQAFEIAPDCGTNGAATLLLEQGSYSNWYAEQREFPYLSWNSNYSYSFDVAANDCKKTYLTANMGELVFWTDGYGPIIEIYFWEEFVGQITSYYYSAPECWSSGCVTLELPGGVYYEWYAEQAAYPNLLWNADYEYGITVNEGSCKTMLLYVSEKGEPTMAQINPNNSVELIPVGSLKK